MYDINLGGLNTDRMIGEDSSEKICLRCGVPITEIKREGSNGCSSRGHYYNKHLWK